MLEGTSNFLIPRTRTMNKLLAVVALAAFATTGAIAADGKKDEKKVEAKPAVAVAAPATAAMPAAAATPAAAKAPAAVMPAAAPAAAKAPAAAPAAASAAKK